MINQGFPLAELIGPFKYDFNSQMCARCVNIIGDP